MANPPYFDLLGKPFARGGRGPDSFDCYGLAREIYRRRGIDLPDFESPGTLEEIEALLAENEKGWKRVPARTQWSLITFRVEGLGAHVGIMLKDDRFLHAIEGAGVTTDRLTNGNFKALAFYDYL